jgi:universal stress protein E
LASSISTIDDCELHVVSVWQGLADFDWQLAVPHDDQLFEAAAKRVLDACLATGNAEIPIGQVHFERGSPGSVIAGLAANLNADLLVMGTVARTGVAGFLIGNAAERVLREVNCSMLTVKPLNFVSPIRLEDDSSPELFPSWNPA